MLTCRSEPQSHTQLLTVLTFLRQFILFVLLYYCTKWKHYRSFDREKRYARKQVHKFIARCPNPNIKKSGSRKLESSRTICSCSWKAIRCRGGPRSVFTCRQHESEMEVLCNCTEFDGPTKIIRCWIPARLTIEIVQIIISHTTSTSFSQGGAIVHITLFFFKKIIHVILFSNWAIHVVFMVNYICANME